MARLPRFILPGQPQHVIQHGNNRQAIFCAASYYHFYLEKLHQAARKHRCDIHAHEYPWSSYRCDALGQVDRLVAPHQEYRYLGATDEQRQSAYRQLFR